MITRNQLTTATPNTLIIGIAARGIQVAVTGALRLRNGAVEQDVIEMVDDDLWRIIDKTLTELRIIKVQHLMLLTTCDALHNFLRKPIFVEQPEVKTVWVGRDRFTVRIGGNEHQWTILRHLFRYVWRCDRVPALKRAEELLDGK